VENLCNGYISLAILTPYHLKTALLRQVACSNKKYVHLHVKCLIFLSNFKHIWFSPQTLVKVPNITFHGNPSSGSCDGMCRQIDLHSDTISFEERAFMVI